MIKHGMVAFAPVIETFLHFGGYVLPFAPEGRFKIYRLKAAIQSMSSDSKSTDLLMSKIPFGQSDTIQSSYLINGLGHLF